MDLYSIAEVKECCHARLVQVLECLRGRRQRRHVAAGAMISNSAKSIAAISEPVTSILLQVRVESVCSVIVRSEPTICT